MNIKNHILNDLNSFSLVKSPNVGGFFQTGLPDTIVLHYTAGPSAQSAIKTLTSPSESVSAHIVVDRKGKITQLVPFNRIAWHAGRSRFRNRTGLNTYSIGIEIVNAGRLKKQDSDFISWFGKKYPIEEVVEATHKNEQKPSYWHRFTLDQLNSVYKLCLLLADNYSIRYIVGHDEIAPGRKIDPGPAFPLEEIRNQVLFNSAQ